MLGNLVCCCWRRAVAVIRAGVIVGHIPRKISSVCSMASFSSIRTLRLLGFRFTSALGDSIDDDGTVVDRGPRRSGSLVVSLDALK